jgi:D-serine deaminase-like pyridoxal phosphate-dependent protein
MSQLPALDDYLVRDASRIQTPALLLYPEWIDENIQATLAEMGGDGNRWRPHVKTTKSRSVISRLLEHGVTQFKCATTRELVMVCESGARDVLVAYPMVGANAARVAELAVAWPGVSISVLIENSTEADYWHGKPVGLFIDVNPGMDRTGISQERAGEIVELARRCGSQFRGLHYYDGQIHTPALAERTAQAERGYERLMQLVARLKDERLLPPEVITSGTPALPCALGFKAFREGGFVHRVSPGTLMLNDLTSLEELGEIGELRRLRPAALVMTTVVSHPSPRRFTCDAGHKSVSADAGVPTCAVVGHPEWQPLKPSEEHLPIEVPAGEALPEVGAVLYLVPKHVCPTVNLFDEGLAIGGGEIQGIWRIDARGHEGPLVKQRATPQ